MYQRKNATDYVNQYASFGEITVSTNRSIFQNSACRNALLSTIIAGAILWTIPSQAAPPAKPQSLGLPAVPIVPASSGGYLPMSSSVSADGQYTAVIPIAVPPGRNNMAPGLAVAYSSNNGNSLLGVGWRLTGLSAITRCNRTHATNGFADGIDYSSYVTDAEESRDRFCLDGQPLMAIQGAYGADNTEYRTRNETYAQIVSLSPNILAANSDMGPDWFTVKSRGGLIRRYEPVNAPRWSANFQNLTQVATLRTHWVLVSETDRNGNVVKYSYTSEDDGAGGVQHLPTKIEYTLSKQDPAPYRWVEFTYERRSDNEFSWTSGVKTTLIKRLKSITLYAPNPEKTGPVWTYRFEYQPQLSPFSQRSVLASVQMCALQKNNINILGGCTWKKEFSYLSGNAQLAGQYDAHTVLKMPFQYSPANLATPRIKVIDIDNDGADELLVQGGGNAATPDPTIVVSRQNENAPFQMLAYAKTLSSYNGSSFTSDIDLSQVTLTDWDGDGRNEVQIPKPTATPQTCSYEILKWNYMAGFLKVASAPDFYANCKDIVSFVDMDGDSLLDQLSLIDDPANPGVKNWAVARNIGGALAPRINTGLEYRGHYITDFNGDGRAGLYFQEGVFKQGIMGLNDIGVYGITTAFDQRYPVMSESIDIVKYFSDEVGPQTVYDKKYTLKAELADFNGDGLMDAVEKEYILNQPGNLLGGGYYQYYLRWNIGNGFMPRQPISITPWVAQYSDAVWELHFADMNRDGRSDIVALVTDPVSSWSTIYIFYSNGYGGFTTVNLGQPAGIMTPENKRFPTSVLGDFNGDGHIDIVRALEGDPNLENDDKVEVLVRQPHFGDRLFAVKDEKATWKRQEVSYSTKISDKMESNPPCAYPVYCVKRGLTVVRSVTSRAGVFESNTPTPAGHTLYYSYEDYRTDRRGNGALGFRKVRTWDPVRPIETITEYEQTSAPFNELLPNPRMPKRVTTVVPLTTVVQPSRGADVAGGTTITARVTRSENSYERIMLNGGKTYAMRPTAWKSKAWEEDVTIDWFLTDLNNPTAQHIYGIDEPADETALSWRYGSSQYDDFGNLIASHSQTAGGASSTYSAKYDNLVSGTGEGWLIGLLRKQQVTATEPNQPSTTRTSDFDYDDRGRIIAAYREKNHPQANMRNTTYTEYADDGLTISVKSEAGDGGVREARFEYDPIWPLQPNERVFPSQMWQPFDVPAWRPSAWVAIHPAYGLPVATMDVNGVRTLSTFDDLGRSLNAAVDGQAAQIQYSYAGHADGFLGIDGIVSTMTLSGQTAQVIADPLGRVRRTMSTGFDGQLRRVDQKYDALGRVIATSRPAVGVPTQFSQYEYDPLDRHLKTLFPDNNSSQSIYTFFETTRIDPLGSKSKIVRDRNGRTIESIQYLNNMAVKTAYEYAPFGLINRTIDDHGNQTTTDYDTLGRPILAADPNAGTVIMTYNGFDELISSTHQQTGHVTDMKTDSLGRVTSITSVDGTTTFTWDNGPHAIGQLVSTQSPDGIITRHEFDTFGRPLADQQIIDGQTLRSAVEYDADGRLAKRHYPSINGSNTPGLTLKYTYNNHNFLNDISWAPAGSPNFTPFWQVLTRSDDAALLLAKLGGGYNDSRDYHPQSGRLERLKVSKGNSALLDLTYTHDPSGMVETETDAVRGIKQIFGYDDLYRLTDWLRIYNGKTTSTIYAYNTIGNLTDVFVNQQLTEHNTYGLPNGTLPHALTESKTSAGTTSIDYDLRGRQTKAGERNMDQYTNFDLPKVVTMNGAKTAFAYNAFGERSKKSGPAGSTLYFGGYEQRNNKEHVFHISGTDGARAQVTQLPGQPARIEYLLSDALGSVSAVMDQTALVTQRLFYDRWGLRINEDGSVFNGGAGAVRHGFTDLEHDDDLGLINMNGRVYDPRQKRMLTVDPHITFPLFGQSWNPYSYALNNPVNFTDPTGFDTCEGSGKSEQGCWKDGETIGPPPPPASGNNDGGDEKADGQPYTNSEGTEANGPGRAVEGGPLGPAAPGIDPAQEWPKPKTPDKYRDPNGKYIIEGGKQYDSKPLPLGFRLAHGYPIDKEAFCADAGNGELECYFIQTERSNNEVLRTFVHSLLPMAPFMPPAIPKIPKLAKPPVMNMAKPVQMGPIPAILEKVKGILKSPAARNSRTNGTAQTVEGAKKVASGGRDLSKVQRAVVQEEGFQVVTKAGFHVEVKIIREAAANGEKLTHLFTDKPICPQCGAVIMRSGGRLVEPNYAVWENAFNIDETLRAFIETLKK